MAKKIKIIYLVLTLVIIGLIAGNVYFIRESGRGTFRIRVGTPKTEDSIQFVKGWCKKEDAKQIQLALMRAQPIETPVGIDRLPDASIWVDDWKIGVCYIQVDVWFEDEVFIFGTGWEEHEAYKQTIARGVTGEDLKAIIQSYQ